MKVLSTQEVTQVAGGDYELSLKMFVPSTAGTFVGQVFQQLVNGQMLSTAAFIAYLQDPNVQAAFDNVRVQEIGFSEFN